MPTLPILPVVGRAVKRAHAGVTQLARPAAFVGLLPNPDGLGAGYFDYALRIGRKNTFMTTRALRLQSIGVREDSTPGFNRLCILCHLVQSLRLVTKAAGLDADIVGVDHIAVALAAGFVTGFVQQAILDLAMTVTACYPIVLHMERMTEQQRKLVLFLATGKKEDKEHPGEQSKLSHCIVSSHSKAACARNAELTTDFTDGTDE